MARVELASSLSKQGLRTIFIPYPSNQGMKIQKAYAYRLQPIIMDLKHYLEKDLKRTRQIILNILLMLYDKNEYQLIRGDMHLSNIALIQDKEQVKVILIDFGKSRFSKNSMEQFVDMIPFIGHLFSNQYDELGKLFVRISNLIYGTRFTNNDFFVPETGGFEYIIPNKSNHLSESKQDLVGAAIQSYHPLSYGGIFLENGELGTIQQLQEAWPPLQGLNIKLLNRMIEHANHDMVQLIEFLDMMEDKKESSNVPEIITNMIKYLLPSPSSSNE